MPDAPARRSCEGCRFYEPERPNSTPIMPSCTLYGYGRGIAATHEILPGCWTPAESEGGE